MPLAWFVARFYHGFEEKAARAVDGEAARGFCPIEVRSWVARGKRHELEVPVLPGYVFVEMQRGDPYRWHEVARRPGFLGFIGGAWPEPALDGRIDDLVARSTEDWRLELSALSENSAILRRGDLVKVITGPLKDLDGHVEWTRQDSTYGPVVQVKLRGLFAVNEIRAELMVRTLERLTARPLKVKSFLDLPVLRP